jgi:hypothetical protein
LVEAPTTCNDWTEINRMEAISELNRQSIICTFEVLRLANVGRNHRNDTILTISAFDVFGSLIEQSVSNREFYLIV